MRDPESVTVDFTPRSGTHSSYFLIGSFPLFFGRRAVVSSDAARRRPPFSGSKIAKVTPGGCGRCLERRLKPSWAGQMHRRGGRPSPVTSRGGRRGTSRGPWLLWLLLPLHLAALIRAQSSTTNSVPLGARGAPLRRQRHLPAHPQAIFHIGAVVNPPDSTSYFAQAIEDAVAEHGITLYAQTVHMNSNPIRIAQSVCENLISSQVFAVVISHPVSGELSPAAVSYTCGFYNVPVIGISSRHSSLSDKNLHRTFLRTVPPYSQQADVWVELLQFLKYRCVVFIHSSDNDGRATLGRFQNKAEPQGIKASGVHNETLERVIEYEPGITDITQELEESKELHCRVFVLYATSLALPRIHALMSQQSRPTAHSRAALKGGGSPSFCVDKNGPSGEQSHSGPARAHGQGARAKRATSRVGLPPPLAGSAEAIPESFQGIKLEDRQPVEPPAIHNKAERRFLCPICGVPKLHRPTPDLPRCVLGPTGGSIHARLPGRPSRPGCPDHPWPSRRCGGSPATPQP
ncbi:hypothetical protein ISCGN_020428 [Ixodes scapularis]